MISGILEPKYCLFFAFLRENLVLRLFQMQTDTQNTRYRDTFSDSLRRDV
nr:MAG TPA: hypothetical protein [Caudoviricetes sp.]